MVIYASNRAILIYQDGSDPGVESCSACGEALMNLDHIGLGILHQAHLDQGAVN